jgi:transcriptional regulator GlxA family with amidase domain
MPAQATRLVSDAVSWELWERAPAPAPELVEAWRRLVATAGAVSVAELAREAGWSPRHFTARFTRAAGLPPKTFARVLRFQRAKALLADAGGPSLCEIALDCGYYDQAHLNRDFREFSGRSPTELMAARLSDGGFQD